MYRYKKLERFEPDILVPLQTGYSSDERYRVSRSETEARTEIVLELVHLDTPYNKTWKCTEEDIEKYHQVISLGNSYAVYHETNLIAVALAESRYWNRTLWIWEFHVSRAYQRQGIGKKLMNIMADEARNLHLRTMLVETQNTNLPAIRFYRAVGFTIEAIDLSYYTNNDIEDFEVAIFMKRKIEPE
jgi:streptothricin acetyltransferase